jgi:general secretion pathway protein A
VDDAHELQPGVLAKLRKLANLTIPRAPLSALSQGSSRALNLILVGQPQLESLLAEGKWGRAEQPVARQCQLQPLASDEVASYVRERQHHRHRADDLTSSAMRLLPQLSGGVPRTINLICDQAAAIAAEQHTERVSRRQVIQGAEQLGLRIPAAFRRPGIPALIALALTTATVIVAALFVLFPPRSTRVGAAESRSDPSKTAVSTPPASPAPAAAAVQASAPPSTVPPSTSTPAVAHRLEASDSFLVTVASFKGPQSASEVVDQLKRKGLPAFSRQGSGWFVVVIGPYASREEADGVRRQVGSAGYADSHVEKQPAAGPRS